MCLSESRCTGQTPVLGSWVTNKDEGGETTGGVSSPDARSTGPKIGTEGGTGEEDLCRKDWVGVKWSNFPLKIPG